MDFTELSPETENETDSLDGTPVWHLEGVCIENLFAVLRTNAWTHYSQYGDDGWGLVCQQAQAESWQEHLRSAGIIIGTWLSLPVKPFERKDIYLAWMLLIPFAVITAPILIFWSYQRKKEMRHIRIAPGLKKVLEYTSISDNTVYPPMVTGKES